MKQKLKFRVDDKICIWVCTIPYTYICTYLHIELTFLETITKPSTTILQYYFLTFIVYKSCSSVVWEVSYPCTYQDTYIEIYICRSKVVDLLFGVGRIGIQLCLCILLLVKHTNNVFFVMWNFLENINFNFKVSELHRLYYFICVVAVRMIFRH